MSKETGRKKSSQTVTLKLMCHQGDDGEGRVSFRVWGVAEKRTLFRTAWKGVTFVLSLPCVGNDNGHAPLNYVGGEWGKDTDICVHECKKKKTWKRITNE